MVHCLPPLDTFVRDGLDSVSIGQRENLPVGGRIKFFLSEWRKLGASRRVLRWIRYGYPLHFKSDLVMSSNLPKLVNSAPPDLITHYQDPFKQQALESMIKELVAKKCVMEVPKGEQGFYSRVFLVPKKSGGWRLVIDLSQLNQSLTPVSFSMDTLSRIKQVLRPGMWATSVDLSDAYHHIPIRDTHQHYLCFQIGEVRYKYLVLPFGLMPGPWLFTEVVKQLKRWAAKNCHVLFQYLDDWLNLSLDREELIQITQNLVRLCTSLGLLVNTKKSELVPTQSIVFLGERLDLLQGRAFPTEERQADVRELVVRLQALDRAPLSLAESLLGKLVATYPTVPWGRLFMRRLQFQVLRALKKGRSHRLKVRVSDLLKAHLKFWLDPQIWYLGVPFHIPLPQLTVFTDASLEGWGVVCQNAMYQGKWGHHSHHINWLELKAVLIALRIFQFTLRGRSVLFLIDNSTAVAYVNRLGGTRSNKLLELMLELGELARELGCQVSARHIRGNLNVLADLASRVDQVVPSEWKLSREAFEWVCRNCPWGKPDLELFANHLNHHLPQYVSPCPDPQAWGIDAMECALPSDQVLYAFPPSCLLLPFLQRLQLLPRFRLVIIVQWSIQAKWLPVLHSLPRYQI